MENKLRAYMDHLFQDVPNTKKAVEVKEEILQNIVDKYHDLVAEGIEEGRKKELKDKYKSWVTLSNNLHPEMRQVTWNRRVRSVKTERSLLK